MTSISIETKKRTSAAPSWVSRTIARAITIPAPGSAGRCPRSRRGAGSSSCRPRSGRCCWSRRWQAWETLPAERRRDGGVRATARTMASLLGDRHFAGFALAGGLAFGAMFTCISGSPFVLQEIYGASPQAFAGVFAVNSVGIVALGQLNGRLAGPCRR